MALGIDYKPLDFSGLAEIPVLYQAAREKAQNAETQRQYAENQDRKISADLARADWEQQHMLAREKQQDAIARTNALPAIMRTAATNPGLADLMGRPYGVSIGHEDTRQMPKDAMTPSGADVAQFLRGGATPADPRGPLQGPTPSGAPLSDPNAELLNFSPQKSTYSEYGLDRSGGDASKPPLQGPPEMLDTPGGEVQAPIGQPASGLPAPLAAASRPLSVDALAAQKEKQLPVTRSYYATVAGERFPITQTPATPFGEEKYDALYQRLQAQDPMADPKVIEAKVLQMRGQDLADTRGTRGLDLRERSLNDLNDYRGKSLALSEANNLRNNAAKIAAARLMSMGMNEKTAVALVGQYRMYDDSAQKQALMKQDQQGMRLEDRIAMELDPNNPNALNQQMANHSIAALSVSTGASGVRVPVSVIHDIQNAYGAALSAKNWAYKQLHGGQNSPEVVAIMQNAVDKLQKLGMANRVNDLKVWDAKAGLGSAWARNPETLGLVLASRAAVIAQLGLPDSLNTAPDFGGEGQPGLPGPGAPPAAPAPTAHRKPKAQKAPGPETDPIRAKAQKALNDPAAPPEAKAAARKILGL